MVCFRPPSMSFRRALRRAIDQVSCSSSTHSSSSDGEDGVPLTGARIRPHRQWRYDRFHNPQDSEEEGDQERPGPSGQQGDMYHHQLYGWGNPAVASGNPDLDTTLVAGSHDGTPTGSGHGSGGGPYGQAQDYGGSPGASWNWHQYEVSHGFCCRDPVQVVAIVYFFPKVELFFAIIGRYS